MRRKEECERGKKRGKKGGRKERMEEGREEGRKEGRPSRSDRTSKFREKKARTCRVVEAA
jgi:hypothetical protein